MNSCFVLVSHNLYSISISAWKHLFFLDATWSETNLTTFFNLSLTQCTPGCSPTFWLSNYICHLNKLNTIFTQIASMHFMTCFQIWLSMSLFCPHTAFNLSNTADNSGLWRDTLQSPNFLISSIYRQPRYFSLCVLSHWYWWVDVTDGDKTWEGEVDCIGVAALCCKSHLFLNLSFFSAPFFFLLPLTTLSFLALSLHHFLFHTSPSLSYTLSSLQEVLELAFSVLYESDEYLNFIAPDKHEVSQLLPALMLTVSDKCTCEGTKRKLFHYCMNIVYMQM